MTPLNRLTLGATSRRRATGLGEGQGEVVAPVGARGVRGAVAVAGDVGPRRRRAAQGVVAPRGVVDDGGQHPAHVREQQGARPEVGLPLHLHRVGHVEALGWGGRPGGGGGRRRRRRGCRPAAGGRPGAARPTRSRRRRRPRPTAPGTGRRRRAGRPPRSAAPSAWPRPGCRPWPGRGRGHRSWWRWRAGPPPRSRVGRLGLARSFRGSLENIPALVKGRNKEFTERPVHAVSAIGPLTRRVRPWPGPDVTRDARDQAGPPGVPRVGSPRRARGGAQASPSPPPPSTAWSTPCCAPCGRW